ncbi:hypothetical protein MSAN_01743600 [Mycena sanguinolenta]|uniref:Uncharacterized protein n=1 Tax=Mycena sanguinolenta TaxID=230812 RepID=A0A8H6XYN8_9AGAR|nr:hypothetical protein MSAN_01743600 [Mycena sanguinolenta]
MAMKGSKGAFGGFHRKKQPASANTAFTTAGSHNSSADAPIPTKSTNPSSVMVPATINIYGEAQVVRVDLEIQVVLEVLVVVLL